MMNQNSSGFLSSIPMVTKNLIIINLLFWVASLVLPKVGIDLVQLFGLHFPGVKDFYPFQFVTYMFMHDTHSFAHVFFNMPMATRLFLQALENIPGEQRQIAAQLGMRGWSFFRFVEWPWLRRQLPPVAALIFMLCFASFATVLSLGGGPQATTIELAIYQALNFDYDPGRAALLAIVQMACCLVLVLLSQRLSKAIPPGSNQITGWRDPQDSLHSRVTDFILIALALLLLLPPLMAVIVDGLNLNLISVLQQPVLWQATWTSLRIALAAGLLCVMLTMMLLWSSRELYARQARKAGQMLELTGMLILAMPGIVLATGFFLLFNSTIGLPERADGIVIFTNALMAVPYAIKVLETPMRDITARYTILCESLGLAGFNRLRVVELRALKRPLAQALAFACVLSIGDFGVVALFGNEAPIEVDWVKRLEFVAGPASAVYGSNALFGTVNTVMLNGADVDGYRVTLDGGSNDSGHVGLVAGK